MWTEQVVSKLSTDQVYHRNDLQRAFKKEKEDMSESSFTWTVYNLERAQKLFRTGYDSYVTVKPKTLPKYRPLYSKKSLSLMKELEDDYPDLSFVIFESALLNEFLNHQIANNTIFLQVEKDASSYIFDTLFQKYPGDVLYRPTSKEFERYWKPDCIVILDLISQSPINTKNPHEIIPEKLLVDIIADKSIAGTFSPSELPDIYENVLGSYQVDKHKLNRYAGRRGKTKAVSEYIGEF